MAPRRGFFAKLFDLSFSEFIAVQIAGVLYGIGIVLIGLGCLGLVFAGLSRGVGAGLGVLIIAPVFFLLYVIFLELLWKPLLLRLELLRIRVESQSICVVKIIETREFFSEDLEFKS